MIGVSQQAIADYERGKIKPSIETGVSLAKVLGTTVEQLLDNDDEELHLPEDPHRPCHGRKPA